MGCTGVELYTTRGAYGAWLRDDFDIVQEVSSDQGGVPPFVDESFQRFLRCGVLAHGFARFQCTRCKHDPFVPLSCKTRGLCRSCGGRRMMALTRHVLDASCRTSRCDSGC